LKDALSSPLLTDADLVLQVKDRLYPLTPFTKFLERLIERLPRRRVSVRLIPQEAVAEIDGKIGEYKAVTESPSFLVEIQPEFAKGGWFYLEAALVRHTGDREARLFGRGGRGGETEFEIPIPSNLRGTVREVLYLPGPVATLFWAPMRAPGFFSQSSLLIHRISAAESFLRRAHRVVLTLLSLRGTRGEARHGLSWRGAAVNLHEAYISTARLQIQRYRGHDYDEFIARHDGLSPAERAAMMASLRMVEAPTLISLVIHVRDVQPSLFAEMLESIRSQIYGHWELVLRIDRSASIECRKILEDARQEDSRIVVLEHIEQANAAASLNAALPWIKGDFFAVIGQHDLLPNLALLRLAGVIQSQPDVVVVYTDHDCIDATGRRFAPHFKPDWNPDFFTAFDYMANLRLWKTDTVRHLNGFRLGFDGAECFDLTLRCIAECRPGQITHIPKVLCHLRDLDGANAASPASVQSTHGSDAGLRALSDHFEAAGATVAVGAMPGVYRVRHRVPSPTPLASIIIPTRDKVEILKACVESIQQRTDYATWEIVIVDNGSCEPQTLAWFRQVQQDAKIRVISYPGLFNYSAINNFAVQHAQGNVVVLLNNDIEVISCDWLTEMVGHALRPEVGAVGAKLLYPNGMVQHAGVALGIGGVAGHVHRYLGETEPGYYYRAIATQNYSVVTAACLAVRKRVYEDVGGLDAVNLKVAFNDVDFCLKLLKAGYRNVFTPYALLYHHESLSRGHDDTPEKKAIFEQEFGYMKTYWGKISDPAYNPNLSLEFEDFSLRRF
jgi:GT2 family glycosyltransferase